MKEATSENVPRPVANESSTLGPSILLTIKETSLTLRLSRRKVHELTKAGRLPAVRIGKAVRYRRETLLRFAAQAEGESDGRGSA